MCIYEKYLKTPPFQNLKHRYPVDTRRFHRHRGDPAMLKPISQCVQVRAECTEAPHRLPIMVIRDGHKDFFRTDIHPGGMRSHNRHVPIPLLSSLSHIFLLGLEETARGAKPSKLLIEIEGLYSHRHH